MASLKLLRLIDAAVSGDVEAAEALGEGYMKGEFGGQINLEKAYKWSMYAAKHGSERALVMLEELKRTGFMNGKLFQ